VFFNARFNKFLNIGQWINLMIVGSEEGVQFRPERTRGRRLFVRSFLGARPVCREEAYVSIPNVEVYSNSNREPRGVLEASKRAGNAWAFDNNLASHILMISIVSRFSQKKLNGGARSQ
jgi:hypothetical protein